MADTVAATDGQGRAAGLPGADSRHPWDHPWRAWRSILVRVYTMDGYHNLSLMAAGVAFYSFLSFVPLLGAIVMTYGLVADPQTVVEHMKTLFELLPPDAAKLISDQLISLVTTAAAKAGLGLIVALLLSIYGAMRAASAMIQALNVVYEEDETRNLLVTTLLAAGLTVGGVIAAIVGVVCAVILGYLEAVVGDNGGGVVLGKILTWLVSATIITAALAVIYRYAPNRQKAKWQWLSVGSLAATTLWLIATLLFGVYAANFANYNVTYGALGAVVVLLMWLWVSSYAVLIGAEINAEAERQTAVDSTTGQPRPMGERGATMADTLPSKRQTDPRRAKH